MSIYFVNFVNFVINGLMQYKQASTGCLRIYRKQASTLNIKYLKLRVLELPQNLGGEGDEAQDWYCPEYVNNLAVRLQA